MKKSLLALAGGLLLTASAADAAKVYFEKPDEWSSVYAYTWSPAVSEPFPECELVEIDDHSLYMIDTEKANVIFLGGPTWATKISQSEDLLVKDGAVYDLTVPAGGEPIANIIDDKYVTNDNPAPTPTAVDIYLRSSFVADWAAKPEYKFTTTDDNIYTLEHITFLPGVEFKVASSNFSTVNCGGDFTVVPGGSYTLTQGSQTNLKVGAGLNDVTFTFDKSTSTLTVSEAAGPAPEVKWYCAWNLEGADSPNWTFGHEFEAQEGEDGVYKVSVTTPEGDGPFYFAVFQGINNTDWNDGIRYTPLLQEDLDVDEEGTYPMQTGIDGVWVLSNSGTWTVVINAAEQAASTISFDWGDSTGEANVLIDRVGDEDHSYESFALETTDNKTFSWSGTLNKGDKLKFNIHGQDYYYDPSIGNIVTDDADADDILTIKYPLSEGEGDVEFDYTSRVDVLIDIENKEVTLDLADAPRVSMYVTNETTGASQVIRVVRQENTRIYKVDYTPTTGDQIDFRLLGTRYECEFDQPTSTEENGDLVYTLTVPNDEKTAPVFTLESKAYTFTINANANNATTAADEIKTLTLSEATVVDPDPTPDPEPDPTADVYTIKGSFFPSWGAETMTASSDGKYVLADVRIEGNGGEFGIQKNPVANPGVGEALQEAWIAAKDVTEVTLDTTMDCVEETGTNFQLTNPGTYTFTFDPTAMTLVVTGTEEEIKPETFSYAIHGEIFGDPLWSNVMMTKSENGKWVIENVDVVKGGFGIQKLSDLDDSQAAWIAAIDENVAVVELDAEIECAVDGSNFTLTNAGKYTFTFDPETMILVVSGEATPIDPDDPTTEDTYVLKAEFFNWAAMDMTAEDGKYILADVEVIGNGGEFLIVKIDPELDNEEIEWIKSDNEQTITLDKVMACGDGKNFILTNPGTYTFTFDPTAMTLVVTGTEEEIKPETFSYAIHGDIFGDPLWSSEDMTKNDDGNWVLSNIEVATGNFGIKQVSDLTGGQSGWYASAGDTTVTLGSEMACVLNGKNFAIEAGTYTFTFNPETLVLVVTGKTSGVSAIEAENAEAIYFNLQGVQVANPENGLYIKVVNGKSQKVMIQK